MNLSNLKNLFVDNGCNKVFIKKLAANDNSKNQIYFGGSFDILNILPITKVEAIEAGDWSRERFKARIKFSWISEEGNMFPAPGSQLILYPKYPEVRFSGFLQGCQNPPSKLMTQRLEGRLLFFGVTNNGVVIGHITSPTSEIADEYYRIEAIAEHGVFKVIELPQIANNREKLLSELLRIHSLGWIKSKSLTKNGLVPCTSSQCGGYTLEAELGIIRNGYSEPDYLEWEIKNFGVKSFNSINSKAITLFTPEPTGGTYKAEGVESFLRKYGYADKSQKADRINFGGIHKVNQRLNLTNLELRLIGFDANEGKIRSVCGRVALVDINGNETASWDFAKMLEHWNRKHNQACYVPSLSDINNERQYKYGSNIMLGTGTDFQIFLTQMAKGNIYYDPGIKMENASTKPTFKKRSQFRIKSQHLSNLYKTSEVIDITK